MAKAKKVEAAQVIGKQRQPKAPKTAVVDAEFVDEAAGTALQRLDEPEPPVLTTDEAELVVKVAQKVRAAYVKGVIETLLAVGKIVLDDMFDGSIDKFKASEKKHPSFRALAALATNGKAGISASNLWYAMALHDNVKVLGKEMTNRIPTSQQRVLVHIKDPKVRIDLAKRTIDEGLTVNALRALVPRKHVTKPGQRGAGRPRLKPEVKALHLLKTVVGILPPVTSVWTGDAKAEEEKAELRQDLAKVRADAVAWLDELDAQLGAAPVGE